MQQIEYAEKLSRATPTQLGFVLEHKFDWPSRGLTKAKVGNIDCKESWYTMNMNILGCVLCVTGETSSDMVVQGRS